MTDADDISAYRRARQTKGFVRFADAARSSIAGFRDAWRGEASFRQEAILAAVLAPAALVIGRSALEISLLLAASWGVLAVELLNSAIERTVDHTSTADHPLARSAKDMGSAATVAALTGAGVLWLGVIAGRVFGL